MDHAKSKLSITLASDVIRAVDTVARRRRSSRSAVIESWLRRAAQSEEEAELRAKTIAYYQSLTAAARDEDRTIARALARAARRLRLDE